MEGFSGLFRRKLAIFGNCAFNPLPVLGLTAELARTIVASGSTTAQFAD
jgi:hypothetical protein